MKTYKEVVTEFSASCAAHLAIKAFAEGSIDYLDSSSQNIKYPYIFLRPVASPGINLNENGISGTRSLTFELYSLDIPKLSDGNALKVMSNTEEIIYTIASYFTLGPDQKYYNLVINTITPVNEGFQDRVFGWVADIDVITPYTLDYCDYPTRP